MISWNSANNIWLKAYKIALKSKLETCVLGINSSSLLDFPINESVYDYFPYDFHGDNQIAFGISQYEKNVRSDRSKTGEIWVVDLTTLIRLYFGDIQSKSHETSQLEIWTNLVDNFIIDQIDNLQTINPSVVWGNFITDNVEIQVAWINGGYGSQLSLHCQTTLQSKG